MPDTEGRRDKVTSGCHVLLPRWVELSRRIIPTSSADVTVEKMCPGKFAKECLGKFTKECLGKFAKECLGKFAKE